MVATLIVPQVEDPTLRVFLQQLAEQVQVSGGSRGDALDAAITWRDLVEKGVVEYSTFTGVNSLPQYTPTDLTLFPLEKPNNVAVNVTMNSFYVTYELESAYAWDYVEVWGYDKGIVGNTSVDDALLFGLSNNGMFVYQPTQPSGAEDTYVFFLRFIRSTTSGPWHDNSGTEGTRPLSPQAFFDAEILKLGRTDLPGLDQDLTEIFGGALVDENGDPITHAEYLIQTRVEALAAAHISAADASSSAADALSAAAASVSSAEDAALSATSAGTAATEAATAATAAANAGTAAANAGTAASNAGTAAANAQNAAEEWRSSMSGYLDGGDNFGLAMSQINTEAKANILAKGFGLFVTAASETMFAIAADNFVFFDPAGGAAGITDAAANFPFFVSGGNTYIKAAYIEDATITNLITATHISDTIVAGNVAFGSAQIGDGAISSLKIANTLESTGFTSGGSSGWRINKLGNAEFNNITVNDGTFNGSLETAGGGFKTASSGALVDGGAKHLIDMDLGLFTDGTDGIRMTASTDASLECIGIYMYMTGINRSCINVTSWRGDAIKGTSLDEHGVYGKTSEADKAGVYAGNSSGPQIIMGSTSLSVFPVVTLGGVLLTSTDVYHGLTTAAGARWVSLYFWDRDGSDYRKAQFSAGTTIPTKAISNSYSQSYLNWH